MPDPAGPAYTLLWERVPDADLERQERHLQAVLALLRSIHEQLELERQRRQYGGPGGLLATYLTSADPVDVAVAQGLFETWARDAAASEELRTVWRGAAAQLTNPTRARDS